MADWLLHTLVLLAGLALLGGSGEALVRGAARLARTLGVSTLVVGLTVVAFGTSAPEAAVTVFASAQGAGDLAIGNVVGSNIANILLVLGVAALIRPLSVSRSLIRLDGPVMIASAAALMVLAWTVGSFTRPTGVAFLVALLVYTFATYRWGRRRPSADDEQPLTEIGRHWWFNLLLVVIGVAGLVIGARMIVSAATGLAELFGISQHIIGLTVVAIGTSLPELTTVVVAARHNQPDIAIGNVIGSNIFNVLFVIGLAALVRPLAVPQPILLLDGPAMLAVCVLFFPLVYTGRRLTRWEGGVLLAMYAGYLAWIVSRAA